MRYVKTSNIVKIKHNKDKHITTMPRMYYLVRVRLICLYFKYKYSSINKYIMLTLLTLIGIFIHPRFTFGCVLVYYGHPLLGIIAILHSIFFTDIKDKYSLTNKYNGKH